MLCDLASICGKCTFMLGKTMAFGTRYHIIRTLFAFLMFI